MASLRQVAFSAGVVLVSVSPASAQGLGLNLGGISVNVGGGGVSVGVGGTGVSVGSSGVAIGTSGAAIGSTGDGSGTSGTGANGQSAVSEQVVELSQQAAVDAVGSKRAVPLDVILAKAHGLTSGEVIDARLISYRSFLLYDLKVLAATGDVSELYFYARSGEQVQTR